jgi:hypothetical protein
LVALSFLLWEERTDMFTRLFCTDQNLTVGL